MKQVYTYIAFMDNLPNHVSLYFKIGRTVNYNERLRQIRTANPFIKTVLIQSFDCEYYLHKKLKKYKVQNEWFCINTKNTVAEVAIEIKKYL